MLQFPLTQPSGISENHMYNGSLHLIRSQWAVWVSAVPISLSSFARGRWCSRDTSSGVTNPWCSRSTGRWVGVTLRAHVCGPVSGTPGTSLPRELCPVPYIVQSVHLGGQRKEGTVHLWCYPVWAFTGTPDIWSYPVWAFTHMPFRVGYGYMDNEPKSRQAGCKQLHVGCSHQYDICISKPSKEEI